jgi:hypothetical protein
MRRDQVPNASGQDTGLAAACTRKDEKRPVAVGHGFLLGRIQAREQGVDLGLGGL